VGRNGEGRGIDKMGKNSELTKQSRADNPSLPELRDLKNQHDY
jgi:hypothetical protein